MADDKMTQPTKEFIIRERDARRPTHADVADAMNRLFKTMPDLEIRQDVQGPELWSWIDPGIGPGHEKYYTLTGSLLNGAEGYPLLSIRQTVAPNLDSYVTFSCVITGPLYEDIVMSINTAFVYHVGAYGGLRSTMMHLANGGDIIETLAHALSVGSDRDISAADIENGDVARKLRQAVSSDKGELN